MMKVKRMLAFVLALAMTLSLVVFPASAEEAFTVSLSDATATVTQTEGQEVTVDVNVSGLKENEGWSALTLYVYYDSEVLEFVEGNYGEAGETAALRLLKSKASLSDQISAERDAQDANENNDKEELCVGIAATAAAKTGDPVLVTETGTIWTLTFKAKADLESQQLPLTLVCTKAEVSGDSTIVPVTNGATITINGVAPTLGKVTLTDAKNNLVLDTSNSKLKFDKLEVNGTTDYTYQARAWSTSGKEITGNVTWKLKSGSNLYGELNGATISEAGLLTIPSDAGAELSGNFFSFWVVATPKDGVSGNAIETNNIQINHEEQKIKTIQIRRKDGATGALIIPGTGESAATAEFVATCTNQYDKPYTGDQPIYWSYGRKDTNQSVSGIKMNGAVLSVSSDAKNVENGSVVLVVTATTGSGIEKVTSNEVEITVQRDNVQRPARIEITGGPSTLAVPKTGEQNATATYTATVYDQYGTEIADPGAISWYLEADGESMPFGTGNERQFIVMKEFAQTFAEGSTSRDVTVKATCNGVSGTKTLTLTREKATVTRLALDGDAEIAVPKSGEKDVEKSYLRVYDQYGVEMKSANLTIEWSKSEAVREGVIFANGGIKVSSDAAQNTFTNGKCQFTITAKYHESGKLIAEATKTITLKREPSVATAITYNDTGTTVVPTDDAQVPAKATPAVEDQYGLLMNNATVEPDGALPTGIVLKSGELYITKAAVAHFGGERKVQVFVKLKCGESAKNTVKLWLELANAQTNPQSAEITGPASIAKPTGEQTNTAEYSILNNEMKDQYGLPITFEPEKLEMELADKNGFAIADSENVTLSKGENGKWIITVTKDAATQQTYVLMAKYKTGGYDAIQCAPVKEITIVDKTVSNTLTVTQGNFTYGEEGKLNPVVMKGSETITNATFVYTKGGQIVTEIKDAGTYTVTATCEDANYIYTGSVDFQILPKQIKVGWIELDGTRYTYNGQQQTVQYTVKDGNTTLVKDRDYTVKDNSDSGTDAGVYRLEITGKGNYTSDPTGAPSVNWNIWEATLTVTGADIPAINYDPDFDGALTVNSVTFSGLMSGETLAKGTDYTVAATVGNRNAGTHQVVLTVRLLNENYKFEQGSGVVISDNANITVTINKIDHRAETVSAGCKYGNQLAMDLAQYLEGGSAAVGTITDNENILDAVEGGAKAIVQNGKLWLQLTNDSNKVGKDATVTLTVESTNYNPFTITVTVTVQGKETQTITASDLNVTYGDAGVKLNASALDNAELAYEVTEGTDVVTVDANGNVTLLKSGTAKIQITAAETEDYGTANTTVTVTVAKRSLTVKANDLTAYVGGQLPALDYTVTGLVSGDTLTTVPELELKDVPAGVDPMKTAGTYTIGFKTAPEADKDKYDLTVETGTLTVSSRPNVNPVPAGNSVKLEEAAGGKLTSSVSRATKGTTVTITVKPDAGYQLEELEVLDKNGEALPLKELANGKFSFQMPDSKVTVQASFVQESTYAGYPDVLPQDWFYSSVRYVTERGLMNGTPNGFEPNMDSSRATIWTILARFSGVDTTVVSGEWYAVARQWAMENGVSDGTNPNGVITREQLATMLYRFAKNKGLVQEPVTADLSVFVDAGQISDYALDAMRWAVSVGLLNGMDGSRLAPQGSAARAQVAAMLMRFDQLAK